MGNYAIHGSFQGLTTDMLILPRVTVNFKGAIFVPIGAC